ncbi:MAG TPA: hypothetical protein VGN95_07745 [Pyrinomonadaceae bacterium]|jgi:hypothetical protein|nr:hypothetical protein [Pyrinomonadaceae bacterium]
MKTEGTIMRRLVKILLLPALLLACASLGLWHVRGQRETKSNQSVETARQPVSRFGDVAVYVREGSFALKDFVLTRMKGSVILKGNLVNKTNHYLDEATFEIKAYDRDGRLLKGVEEKTIFAVRQFKANASMPVNAGYGVWLQGIPLDTIARIEISETGHEAAASSLIRMIPLASHAVFWKDYSEIEE